jgi:carboxyl-terminal processing protease
MGTVRGRSNLGGFVLGVVATLGLGYAVRGFSEPEARASRASLDRESFHKALDEVLDRYVDPVDESEVLARGLKHMVAELDPHSHYLTARERKTLRRRTRGGTLGMAVVFRRGERPLDRWLEILAVSPGSPAEGAGLHPGDHIVEVRGQQVAALLSQAEAEALLVGSVGETVGLAVQRKRDVGLRQFDLTLEELRLSLVEGDLVATTGGKVAHVTIRGFRANVGEQVKLELKALRRAAGKAGLAGIVLDVRENPGGTVDEALVVADLFVGKGVLTRTRGRGGRILREERAHAAGTDAKTPLVVLQDRHTASAAELLSVALQETGRAQVVGERSYGKGTVQEVMGLEDGSVLTLTIARYFSPKDRAIEKVGVEPDVHHVLPKGSEDAAGLEVALKSLGLQALSR